MNILQHINGNGPHTTLHNTGGDSAKEKWGN